MTEREWREAVWPRAMLDHLTTFCGVTRSPRGRRKLRLFGVAYCRRVEHLLENEKFRQLIGLVEEWADDATKKKADEVLQFAVGCRGGVGCGVGDDLRPYVYANLLQQFTRPQLAAMAVSWLAARNAEAGSLGHGNAALALEGENIAAEAAHQCVLLRDIFGNPFRPVTFDAAWRTSTAVALASQMYDSRDFGAMPILADALQDAGCSNDDILTHCRDSHATHVRGCWVVDLVLGKS
jgi:hypothetical protein